VSDETARAATRLDQIEGRLGDIEAAMQRLDQDTYGTCQSCGRAISDDELAVDPTARWCGNCQPASAGGDQSADPPHSGGPGESAGVEQSGRSGESDGG
jgi:RNA polymerase-binding transcription factor DksA